MSNIRIYAFADEADSQIDGQIAAMKRNGLNGLEIRGVDGTNVSDISLETAKAVKAKLDAAGLCVWSIGSPIGKIDIESDEFEAHLDKFRHTLELAKLFGARNIRMFSFFMPEGKDPAAYKDAVIERLKAFAAIAKDSGVALCHENEKGIYGDTPERCLELLEAVPELHCVFDPANFVQSGEDTWRAWELLKSRVRYVHIKESLPDGNVVPAGKGDGQVEAIAKDFIAMGGADFTMEPHLAVFDGLAGLEREGNTSGVGERYTFSDNNEAFDTACDAFKALILQ